MTFLGALCAPMHWVKCCYVKKNQPLFPILERVRIFIANHIHTVKDNNAETIDVLILFILRDIVFDSYDFPCKV